MRIIAAAHAVGLVVALAGCGDAQAVDADGTEGLGGESDETASSAGSADASGDGDEATSDAGDGTSGDGDGDGDGASGDGDGATGDGDGASGDGDGASGDGDGASGDGDGASGDGDGASGDGDGDGATGDGDGATGDGDGATGDGDGATGDGDGATGDGDGATGDGDGATGDGDGATGDGDGATGDGDGATGDGTTGDGDGTTGDGDGDGTNLAFVTTNPVIPGTLGSLAAADALCGSAAATAGLPDQQWMAVLSTSTDAFGPRLQATGARGWRRTDGRAFADTATDLLAGATLYPPRLDEFGNDLGPSPLVTGTAAGGGASIATCEDYQNPVSTAESGRATRGDVFTYSGEMRACDIDARLLCLGTTENVAVSLPPPSGRLAFVSAATWSPDGGLAGADGVCQAEADAGGLGGRVFRALLATESASASSRFDLGAAPWQRPDGVRLWDSPADLDDESLLRAPILWTLAGALPAEERAWTGAFSPSDPGSASTCQSWSVAASPTFGRHGWSRQSSGLWFTSFNVFCNTQLSLYCLEA